MATTKAGKAKAKRATNRKTASRKVARRPKGLGIHIGLNHVDPGHYDGWSGELNACLDDARSMAKIATAQGMTPKLLLDGAATRRAVLAALGQAAKTLESGDFLFLTYSGHGGQVPDVTDDGDDEDDGQDETWCLFDGELLDDEMYVALGALARGVHVLVLSDSCHSGTVTRAAPPRNALVGSRLMPPDVAERVYRKNQAFYDGLQRDLNKRAGRRALPEPDAPPAALASPRAAAIAARFRSQLILISGCQDNQLSSDGAVNGLFTEKLLATWRDGAFRGNYVQFHAAIKSRMPASQTPNLFTLGPAARFLARAPFRL